MKKRKNLVYLVVFLFLFLLPVQVRADMGPKPSVVIDFIGIEDEEYYVTLLSKTAAGDSPTAVFSALLFIRHFLVRLLFYIDLFTLHMRS